MNQVDQNINKDMIDSDLIDVESLEFSDDQTWLYRIPDDSGEKVDIIEYNLACDWPINEDDEYLSTEKELYALLDGLLKIEVAMPDRHKFDSRTYVRPKKRAQRPSIQSIVEVTSNQSSISPTPLNQGNKYLTYNKYSNPLGPVSPMLRLKTFNVDTNTDNSSLVKEYANKRRSLAPDDDPQLEDMEVTLVSDNSERLSSEHAPFKPINIDLSQPAHNIYHTFNKGMMNMIHESGSLNMYQSGESLMRMSPPSLVSSLVMEHSGNFNHESMESRKSIHSHKDSGLPASGRESIDHMMTSMTLSILDEKDMSTSFLSQTTYPDNDSLMDSLPPSLVSSVNSSYIVSNNSKLKPDQPETNVFSSTTFTHLEQSEKLLSARPRCQLYNSFKRDLLKSSESYTKSREEPCQNDVKVLNENCDSNLGPQPSKLTPKAKPNGDMSETMTLHYSNNKYQFDNDAEKENLNATFETNDVSYKDMGALKGVDPGKNSLNITLDKQELNEIIQARQKLSLARKALPNEPPPNQIDTSPVRTIQLPNQTITVPRQSMENASELLSRRRAMNYEKQEEKIQRDTPKRNATFKKVPAKPSAMDATVVFVKSDDYNIIDINSATLNLIDSTEKTLQQDEWSLQQRAMGGSSDSTDTATCSCSSPPDSAPEPAQDSRTQVASTPLVSLKRGAKAELLNLQNTISPIYDTLDDKSYIVPKNGNTNVTVINTATIHKSSAKRDILANRGSPEKKTSPVQIMRSPSRQYPGPTGPISGMPPPTAVPRKTGLPTSKLRQYSSHKELNRIPAPSPAPLSRLVGRPMARRGVYASNPALSPTAPERPAPVLSPQRRDSYTLATYTKEPESQKFVAPPPLVRQGTETLRRDRTSTNPPSRDLRNGGPACGLPVSQRSQLPTPPSATRPYSIAGSSQLRISRPTSVPIQRPPPVQTEQPRPNTGERSALPRPSRLPAPRRALRPPSVYSVAPSADVDHY